MFKVCSDKKDHAFGTVMYCLQIRVTQADPDVHQVKGPGGCKVTNYLRKGSFSEQETMVRAHVMTIETVMLVPCCCHLFVSKHTRMASSQLES